MKMKVDALEHIVLIVKNIGAAVYFYSYII